MEREPGDRLAPDPWPLPIRIELSGTPPGERAAEAERCLRARPGVAVFVAVSGDTVETISVSACGDLRAFVGSRLRGEGPRADLSEVTTRVEACECGSGLEADLACDAVSRARTPESADLAAAQRATCFVHLDPASDAPACRVIDDRAALAGLDPSRLVGPFAARAHAESWASMLDTRYELCRKPSVLARQPRAEACSYKDMGLCPAPCDGSEPMDAYRDRCGAALTFDGAALEAERARVSSAIDAASSSMDFERAGSLQQSRAVLDAARSNGVGWITAMHRFRVLAVMPAGKKGWARVFLHADGRTEVLADVNASIGGFDDAVLRMIRVARERGAGRRSFDGGAADQVSIIAQHARSARRTRGRLIPIDDAGAGEPAGTLDQGINRADLIRAVRRAADAEPAPPGSTPEDDDAGSDR